MHYTLKDCEAKEVETVGLIRDQWRMTSKDSDVRNGWRWPTLSWNTGKIIWWRDAAEYC